MDPGNSNTLSLSKCFDLKETRRNCKICHSVGTFFPQWTFFNIILQMRKLSLSKMPMYDWGDGPLEISIGCSRTTTGGLRYSMYSALSDNVIIVIVRYHRYLVTSCHHDITCHMSSSPCRLFVRSRHPLGWSSGSCWMLNWRVLRRPL